MLRELPFAARQPRVGIANCKYELRPRISSVQLSIKEANRKVGNGVKVHEIIVSEITVEPSFESQLEHVPERA